MIIIVRLKIKVPDSLGDKEINEIAKKYIDVMPCKTFKVNHCSDALGWFY